MSPFVYEPGNSVLHRIDAVTKFFWLMLATTGAILASDPWQALILYLSIALTGVVLGKISPRALFRRTIHVGLVSIWLFCLLAVISPPNKGPSLSVGFLNVSLANLSYAATIALRIFTLGTASTILVLTTDPRRMVAEFVKYAHLPYKAGFAVYAALRFLPLLQHEARIIYHAHAIRTDPHRGLMSRFQLMRRLAIPLLAGALRRIQVMAVAMDVRGFGAHPTRTELDELHRDRAGWMVAGSQLILLLVLLTWKIAGNSGPFFVLPPIGGK
jgi:energy-coupling factor transport system permease protein